MTYDLTHELIEMSYKALKAQDQDLAFRMSEINKRIESDSNLLSKEKSLAFYNDTLQHIDLMRKKYHELDAVRQKLIPVLEEITDIYEQDSVKNFFFTFGDSPTFPFKSNEYVIVRARNILQAARAFMRFYPNQDDPFTLNCADYYDEGTWIDQISSYYKDGDMLLKPAVVIDFTEEHEAIKGRPLNG